MRGRSWWKSSCSYQSSWENTCQKQHIDILPLALIPITTRHRRFFGILDRPCPAPAFQLTAEASGSDLQELSCWPCLATSSHTAPHQVKTSHIVARYGSGRWQHAAAWQIVAESGTLRHNLARCG